MTIVSSVPGGGIWSKGQKASYGPHDRQFFEVFPSNHISSDSKPSPLLLFVHGGAWRSGSTSDHYDLANHISKESNITVILIEYRLTLQDNNVYHPDHISDVYQAMDLIFHHSTASQFGYDTSKVVFAGHSAGGYMVNAAALASDQGQTAYGGPIRDIPKLAQHIRQSIRAFVAVESIFSIVDLLNSYPDYIKFVQPSFYPPGLQPVQINVELEKAGIEAWPVDAVKSEPKIYIIHSQEDTLLNSEYNARGIKLLKDKGLNPTVDLTSFKGDHDDLLHTKSFWQHLISIVLIETNII